LRAGRGARLLLSLSAALVLSSSVEAEPNPTTPQAARPPAEITLVGNAVACAGVQEVVAELLARDGASATWGTRNEFQPRDIFDQPASGGVAAWIDLSAPAEARLYFRDAVADRFYLRALPLAHGIDEVAKEAIAHVVSNAVVALGQGTGEALTRSEAREALHLRPAPEEKSRAVEPPTPLRFAVAALAGAQLFAADLPIAAKGTLALAVARGPRWHRTGGCLGAWLDLGYQLWGRYRGPTVGADVQTLAARGGLAWEIERRVRWRFALGAGADRYHYQPQGDSARVELARAGSFYVPVVTFAVGFELRLLENLALTSRLLVDVPLAKIHFDLHDGNGRTMRVLEPYPVLPAAALGLTFVF
jgi:hypothetical protein